MSKVFKYKIKKEYGEITNLVSVFEKQKRKKFERFKKKI